VKLINENISLRAFCDTLAGSEFISVDTEFLREKTYWPKLCVLQIAGPESAVAIDTLSENIDLSPVFRLLNDKNIVKVFHAGRQDLEIFFHLTGTIPVSIFDTQVAAMVCGFGDSISYEHLVQKLTGSTIDKSSRFTDWSLRPLSSKQIDYAISDVTHLRVIYEKLSLDLKKSGRSDWITEEMEILTLPGTYSLKPKDAYKRVKSKLTSPRFLAILREIAAWREIKAQQRNVPRNRILRDETLVEIASQKPSNINQLSRIRGLNHNITKNQFGKEILSAVALGKTIPDSMCPLSPAKKDLPKGMGAISDLLKVLLKFKCEEYQVAAKLLATSSDIDQIAAYGSEAPVRALRGWRREIFGDDALKLLSGDMHFIVENKKLKLV